MKKQSILILLGILLSHFSFSQIDSSKTITEQIKDDRDKQLQELKEKLQTNETKVSKLTEKLSSIDAKKTNEKIKAMENLQLALDSRIKIIEETPKTRTSLNGQLAFTELLSIQRDIQPADLFISSRNFFTQLENVGDLQKYSDFISWKAEYDKWYEKQEHNDQMLELINNSVNLIGDAANNVPIYGSIVQTVSSGVSSLVSSFGKRNKALAEKTPKMLALLNTTSQFEYQKAIIDHEWEVINKELEQLQDENNQLLKEQLVFYGLNENLYKKKYLAATLDNEREIYKNNCRKAITDRLMKLDSDKDTKGKWMGQVQIYMFKVQSLRLRFGQLTTRMLANIERYENIISVYSNNLKFPLEFTNKLVGLNSTLSLVKNKFYSSFKPSKYIEDSAVMYIERQ